MLMNSSGKYIYTYVNIHDVLSRIYVRMYMNAPVRRNALSSDKQTEKKEQQKSNNKLCVRKIIQ